MPCIPENENLSKKGTYQIDKTDNCGCIGLMITGASTVATFLCFTSDIEMHSYIHKTRHSHEFISNLHRKVSNNVMLCKLESAYTFYFIFWLHLGFPLLHICMVEV